MKVKLKFILSLIFFGNFWVNAQKALPIQVESILTKMTLPSSAEESFSRCTKETDPSNGNVSVKDAGQAVNDLQQKISDYMTQLGSASMNNSYSSSGTSMPSADQIAQMQQNAMQNMNPQQTMKMAQQSQHPTTKPQKIDITLMKELGNAQVIGGKINPLINNLSAKVSQLSGDFKRKKDTIKMAGNCPEFKAQGDIALPKCGCVREQYFIYYTQRVTVANEYLQKLYSLLQQYLPDIKNSIAVIDKTENDIKYGDALSMPAYKQQAIMLQQQGLSSITSVLAIIGNATKDTGSEYANLASFKNGYLPEPCQK